MQELEQTHTDKEIEENMKKEQEDIERLSPEESYEYEFDQRFSNVKEELLELIYGNLKNITKRINEK